MTVNELKALISGIDGAIKARTNGANIVVVPCEDGIVKVSATVALEKNTKNRKAFNLEAAVAEYKAWEAWAALKEAEKASKPAKVNGVNPEAQARRDELDTVVGALPAFTDYTATDIMHAIEGKVAFTLTPMNVGQSAKRLVDKGILTMEARKPEGSTVEKKYYTKA